VEAAGRLCHSLDGQGSQAHLSLPPSCEGVSYSKAEQHGSHQSSGVREEEWVCVGIGESRRKRSPTRASESVSPVTGGRDGCGSLGQEVGAQGALARPERARGCSIPSLPLRYVGENRTNVERLIRCCRSPRGRKERSKGSLPKPALPVTEKAPE